MGARVSVLIVLVCLLTALVVAQVRGGIVITVTRGQVPIPGATITLSGPDQRTGVTDERGRATFAGLLPGTYQITVELKKSVVARQTLSLTPGTTEYLPIPLGSRPLPLGTADKPETQDRPSPPPMPTARVGGRMMAEGIAVAAPAALSAGSVSSADYWRWERNGNRHAEKYDDHGENPFRTVTADPLSTFSIDVDTASYANIRRFLNEGSLPPEQAVRIEEMINYFKFDYPQPKGEQPFSITTELADCPWNPKHRLALVGLKGREIAAKETPARNLVFLIDVSGSMQTPDKLPLVRHGMRMLANGLNEKDRVAIVVYAGASGVVLETTPGDRHEKTDRAIEQLQAGGSTNGGAGIRLAYQLARDAFITGGVNRVILATDGDFNVGVTDQKQLERLIERERESGVFLSVLGVGTGNINDALMEMLADKGNGNYAYLDSMHEAHRVLVKEAGSTLVTIAKDVKIQVEFNPKAVNAYRLIGYENRMLRDQDFNDDRKDAGEIGAGHSVTAIYEIVPAGVDLARPSVDPLKYSPSASAREPSGELRRERAAAANYDDELLTVKLRYKAPDGDESRLTSAVIVNRTAAMTTNLGFASAVAEAGMLLRGSGHVTGGSYAAAIARARKFRGEDVDGYRAEFTRLMELAVSLAKNRTDR
jgi:Ca-activated chloride channel family protein